MSRTLLRFAFLALLLFVMSSVSMGGRLNPRPPIFPNQLRTIDSWLDYKFDANAPMGDSRNPAVVLPPGLLTILGDVAGAKRIGDTIFIPAAEFQKIARQPLAALALAPVLNQITNVKSFDGFSAVDLTGLIKNLPSEIIEAPDNAARKLNGQNPDELRKLLRDGDIVFGSHVFNYITWGRFNHVAIVLDAARGVIAESTARVPSDMPGVRVIDWDKFVSGYARVGIVRIKPAKAEQLPRVVSWINERRGKPYRWPLIQGLEKSDQSRFYCSQLVWIAFKEVLNLDLDVDKGVLVFPDDIYYSKEYVDVIVP
jgi:uncharacterized protein YycO